MNSRNIILLTLAILIGGALVAYAVVHRADFTAQPRALNLAEFGVALEIPASLSDLTYTAKDESEHGPGTVLHMIVSESCEIGALYEIRKDAMKSSGTTWTEETLEQFQLPTGNTPAQVKEFTDFYLVFEPSQEPCSSDERKTQTETKKRLALWNSLVSAHYMSQ